MLSVINPQSVALSSTSFYTRPLYERGSVYQPSSVTPTDLFSTSAVVSNFPESFRQQQQLFPIGGGSSSNLISKLDWNLYNNTTNNNNNNNNGGVLLKQFQRAHQQQQQQQQHFNPPPSVRNPSSNSSNRRRMSNLSLPPCSTSSSSSTPSSSVIRLPQPTTLSSKDFSKQLFVDCSIEYDLPNAPKIPKNSDPILMIHPGYAKKVTNDGLMPNTRSHTRPQVVPAVSTSSVNNNNSKQLGIQANSSTVCPVKNCQCMNSRRIMVPPTQQQPQTRQQQQRQQQQEQQQQQQRLSQLNMAVKRSYNGQAVQMDQFDRYKMTNQDMGMISTSTCSYQMITPPEAKRSKMLLDQHQVQNQQLQQQLQQQQQQQQKHLHEEQQRQAMAAPFWRHPGAAAYTTLPRPQMNATYWPITPPQNFQTPCDFYNCKIFQREHSRYLQQQREQRQRAAQVAVAAAQAMRIRTNPAAAPAQQLGQQHQHGAFAKAPAGAGQTGTAPAPACAGCVNGSCGVSWNKENVGLMRSL